MRFVVTRTSQWKQEDPRVCEGAQREELTITRDDGSTFQECVYFVEIADFKQLQEFLGKHGDCVIKEQAVFTSDMELEIYDDYRE